MQRYKQLQRVSWRQRKPRLGHLLLRSRARVPARPAALAPVQSLLPVVPQGTALNDRLCQAPALLTAVLEPIPQAAAQSGKDQASSREDSRGLCLVPCAAEGEQQPAESCLCVSLLLWQSRSQSVVSGFVLFPSLGWSSWFVLEQSKNKKSNCKRKGDQKKPTQTPNKSLLYSCRVQIKVEFCRLYMIQVFFLICPRFPAAAPLLAGHCPPLALGQWKAAA